MFLFWNFLFGLHFLIISFNAMFRLHRLNILLKSNFYFGLHFLILSFNAMFRLYRLNILLKSVNIITNSQEWDAKYIRGKHHWEDCDFLQTSFVFFFSFSIICFFSCMQICSDHFLNEVNLKRRCLSLILHVPSATLNRF